LIDTSRGRRQDAATPHHRVFGATQARLDNIKGIKLAVEKEAERHWRIACAHLAEADDLAVVEFQLTVALARIERRLIKAQADGVRSRLNGRRAAA
jgi:hypothetical protein